MLEHPITKSVTLRPKSGLGIILWILVLILLILYPAYSIWRLLPFYADVWVVIDIVLVVFSAVVGLQLLDRHPAAIRNAKIFFVLNILSATTTYAWVYVLDDQWRNVDQFVASVVRIGLIWLLVFFSRRSRELFPNEPLANRNPLSYLRRHFSGNLMGQFFLYCTMALLVVAVTTSPTPSPTDGGSKGDTEREKLADTWLVDHPDNLKQLMKSPTGVRPTLKISLPVAEPVDAKTIYEQTSPAVVLISTNTSFGAGFFLTADGVVATSQHVLDGSTDAVVMLKSGELFPISSILTCDKNKDYCLLKIDATDTPYVSLGDSTAVEVGDPVVVIGHPYGNYFSLSNGLISKIHEYEKAGTLFQFTAPASPGNSGGPVFNTGGQVVGISESIFASNDAQNLNFATSVSSLREAIEPQPPL